MSSTLDRLRRLQGLRPQRPRPEPTYVPLDADGDELPPPAPGDLGAALAPGEEVANEFGTCYCVTERYDLARSHGPRSLGDLLARAPATLAPFHPEFGLEEVRAFQAAAFVDTETTGLGGGAGVYAFMVGVGTFEATPGDDGATPAHFVVRQYFMRHPGEEPAVLAAVARQLHGCNLVVTFNGRSFDLPLLRTRYLQNRRWLGSEGMPALLQEGAPHLDLLYPARRLWRRRLQSCRLINLEQMILGLTRSEEDVPGALIPYLYQEYLRTGHGGAMRRVFYHNREDIVTMVALAEQLVAAYRVSGGDDDPDGVPAGVQEEDWVALGACYAGRGEAARAETAYSRALDTIRDDRRRRDAFAHLGDLLKRQGRWEEAAALWELWLTSVPGADASPYIELAKYSEWQLGDLERAEMWTAWALHTVSTAPLTQRIPGQVADLEHRLARIRRKRQSPNHPIT